MIKNAIILIGISALLAGVSALVHPKRPAWYRSSNPSDFLWTIDENRAGEILTASKSVLWVDARSRKEFEEGHYPGAILINQEQWSDLMFRNQDNLQEAIGHPVIVYCDGAGCDKSSEIAQRLRELVGLDPVYVLKGDWKKVTAP